LTDQKVKYICDTVKEALGEAFPNTRLKESVEPCQAQN
jgi:hypothetical protein